MGGTARAGLRTAVEAGAGGVQRAGGERNAQAGGAALAATIGGGDVEAETWGFRFGCARYGHARYEEGGGFGDPRFRFVFVRAVSFEGMDFVVTCRTKKICITIVNTKKNCTYHICYQNIYKF